MRTVWITLRAMNYTQQAFRNAIMSVEGLTDAEKKHRDNLLKTIDTARLNIQTGVLYMAMISMVSQKLIGLLSLTQVGSEYMSEFNQTVQELKVAFADTLFEALKPLLDVLQIFMNIIKDNAPLRTLVVVGGLLAIVLGGLYSAYLILHNQMLMNATMMELNAFMSGKTAAVHTVHGFTVHGLTIAYKSLAVAVGAAFAGFTIAYSALQGLNPVISGVIAIVLALAAAFMYLYVAHSMATVGITAALGAAAGGAALATISNIQNTGGFAVGTRALPSTGMFLGHRGEIVYNPRTDKPTGVGKEIFGEGGGRGQYNKIDFHVNTLHTKSDIDEVDEKIGNRLARAMKNGR